MLWVAARECNFRSRKRTSRRTPSCIYMPSLGGWKIRV
jgi:hypothetical protein